MESNEDQKKRRWITKPCLIIFFLSLLISIAGGFVLGLWLHKYHPTNSQLWMVPFGFILFITSLIVWLSLTIPDQCISKSDEDEASKMSQPNDPGDNSLCVLKR